LRAAHGLTSVVLWGDGERQLAEAIVAAAPDAAIVPPATRIADLVALARTAALMVSGDTGPAHIAAAVGTPFVGIYGPTTAARNGPISRCDVAVSRDDRCECPLQRRCTAARWCLLDIGVDEVAEAVTRRLMTPARA
jgi:ADP-heptose:LPS heptosyltransferase